MHPKRPETLVAISRHYELKGETDKALQMVSKAILENPKHADAHITKGNYNSLI